MTASTLCMIADRRGVPYADAQYWGRYGRCIVKGYPSVATASCISDINKPNFNNTMKRKQCKKYNWCSPETLLLDIRHDTLAAKGVHPLPVYCWRTEKMVAWYCGAPGVFPHPNANPNPNPTGGEKLPERLILLTSSYSKLSWDLWVLRKKYFGIINRALLIPADAHSAFPLWPAL